MTDALGYEFSELWEDCQMNGWRLTIDSYGKSVPSSSYHGGSGMIHVEGGAGPTHWHYKYDLGGSNITASHFRRVSHGAQQMADRVARGGKP